VDSRRIPELQLDGRVVPPSRRGLRRRWFETRPRTRGLVRGCLASPVDREPRCERPRSAFRDPSNRPAGAHGRDGIRWPSRWLEVARDPLPFLALGICSADWLETSLPRLIDASSRAPLAGGSLIHLDVRSDNVCFIDGRAVVIDWNHATAGNPDLDIAFWLPSLHAEGGPHPEAVLPDAPELAAWVAGFFCARAGGEPLPDAPHVRPLQLLQSRTALPWAARALHLPPP
jgi:hypothetical protein